MGIRKRYVPFLTLLMIAIAGLSFPPLVPIAHAISCGDTITSDTTLNSDMHCFGSYYGIVVGANNISLDCQEHSILGGGGAVIGVEISNRQNVTIRNCVVGGFSHCLELDGSSNNFLQSNTARCAPTGFTLQSSSKNVFQSNTVVNGAFCILSVSSNSNIFKSNIVTGCSPAGIFLAYGSNNLVYNNY